MRALFFSAALALALGGCRASGPDTPAHTVAEFFRKYDGRPGFKTTDWSAGLLTRVLLGRIGKLGGSAGDNPTQVLTAVRSLKVLSFAPTSSRSRQLADQGLTRELDALLQNERYSPLAVQNSEANTGALRYSVRRQGDRVQELVATGTLNNVPDSFLLVDVAGNFTAAQVDQLVKLLPQVVADGN